MKSILPVLAALSGVCSQCLAVVALNSPTSEFNALLLNGPSDPVEDNQANRVDIELVGNDDVGLFAFYTQFNDNGGASATDGTVFYRVRVSGNSG